MTITLTPEIEGKLNREARRYGTTPELLVLGTLRERFSESISSLEGMPLDVALADLIAEAEALEPRPPPLPGTRSPFEAREALLKKVWRRSSAPRA